MSLLPKIIFKITPDEDGYPPAESEGMWATLLPNGNFKIDNIPFYVMGISSDDEVSAEEDSGEFHFKELVRPSTNSTFRIMLSDSQDVESVRGQLAKMGCRTEFNQNLGLIAIEIPGNIDIHPFLDFIVSGKNQGELDYEEATLRHRL